MKPLASFDPFSSEVIEDPREFYTALRREAPLYELPNGAYYLISRFEDVQRAVMDTDTYSSNLVAVLMSNSGAAGDTEVLQLSGGEAQATDVLAIADPPQHTRQRKVSNRAFTMRRVAAMEPRIRQLAESLVDDFLQNGQRDWVAGVAVPLPMTIIVEMLGFPLADIPYLKTLSDSSVALLSGINTADQMAEHSQKVGEMFQYLSERFDEAVEQPGDNVLGDLVRASQEEDEHFSRDEVVSILVQLLTAGNETTTSLIGSAMLLLVQDTALQQRLREKPQQIEAFVEEALRLESPFNGHFRLTRTDTEVGGKTLPAGSRVMLLWASANRDEQAFSDPESVNLERKPLKKHLSFGYGIHHCIGAALARMEARVAIETVLAKTAHIELAEDNDLSHVPSLFIRSLRRLNIDCR